MEHHHLFNKHQFGFRHSRSTQQVITIITSSIEENIRKNKASIIATRDIKKAFDTAWHRGLLYKLDKITDNNILFTGLIRHYLINRTVTPILNNTAGTPFIPKAGVPQGSVNGPTLFNIFVNDIPPPKYIDTIRPQFADDIITVTRSFGKDKNKVNQATTKLQNELKIIEDWERDWQISVNPPKCKIAIKIQNLEELDLINNIHIDNTPVQTTNTVKILGYTYSFMKTSTTHIANIMQKAKLNIHKSYIFKTAPTKRKKKILYKALIRPILEYPATQISNTGITNKQKVQNKATRFINNTKLSDRIKSQTIHDTLKLEAMNVRLNKMKTTSYIECMKDFTMITLFNTMEPTLKLMKTQDMNNQNHLLNQWKK